MRILLYRFSTSYSFSYCILNYMEVVMNRVQEIGLRDTGFLDLALSGNLNLGKVTKQFAPSTLTSAMVGFSLTNWN